MIQLHTTLFYLLIFTIVSSFVAYKTVIHAYDVAYAEYEIAETIRVR